jgi:hypothetical protein
VKQFCSGGYKPFWGGWMRFGLKLVHIVAEGRSLGGGQFVYIIVLHIPKITQAAAISESRQLYLDIFCLLTGKLWNWSVAYKPARAEPVTQHAIASGFKLRTKLTRRPGIVPMLRSSRRGE